MKIVIDIPEGLYEIFKSYIENQCASLAEAIIANGTPFIEVDKGEEE